jgi:predicted permease
MGEFGRDVKYALRQLGRSWGFTATAVLSLTLGIGATAAVFSVIWAVLLHPYPYPTADRIMRLVVKPATGQQRGVALNGPQIREMERSPVLDGLLVVDQWTMGLTSEELPEEVDMGVLSGNSFRDLGVPMLMGRGLSPTDSVDGQEPQPVCVIAWQFWQRHFNGSPTALGRTLELDHKKYTIVGIAPPRFRWGGDDVYVPLKLTNDPGPVYIVMPLLKPGVAKAEANQALQPLMEEFARQTPKRFPEHFRVQLMGLNDWVVKSSLGRTLYLLLGAVSLLLAIGCGNVSILLLARGTVREHELAVRAAVGAGRRRIVQQLLTEALVLAVTGAALGVGLAFGLVKLILWILPKYQFAPEVQIGINLPVLLFSTGVALGTVVLFGLWPAWRMSRPEISRMMQAGSRKVAGSQESRRMYGALIAGQIALTLTLMAAAGGAMRGVVRLMHTPLGYDPHNVMPVWVPLNDGTLTTWGERAAYFDRVKTVLSGMPGVENAAISSSGAPPYNGAEMRYEVLGSTSGEQMTARVNLVSPEYFHLLGIPLVQGRIWTEAENRTGAHYAVINKAMERREFPNGNPVGRQVRLPTIEGRSTIVLAEPGIAEAWLQIVGVVADARNDGLKYPVQPAIYVPDTLFMGEYTGVLVKTQTAPAAMVHAIRTELRKVNADQYTSSEMETLEDWIREEPEWTQEHLVAWTFGLFAGLALVLAAMGLYSVVSYSVAQRTSEFGIRMALGAERGHVLRIVFASTAWSVGAGIAAGVGLTLAMSRVLVAWSAESAGSVWILSAVVGLLAMVALAACLAPALRAARVDPMTALRCE